MDQSVCMCGVLPGIFPPEFLLPAPATLPEPENYSGSDRWNARFSGSVSPPEPLWPEPDNGARATLLRDKQSASIIFQKSSWLMLCELSTISDTMIKTKIVDISQT